MLNYEPLNGAANITVLNYEQLNGVGKVLFRSSELINKRAKSGDSETPKSFSFSPSQSSYKDRQFVSLCHLPFSSLQGQTTGSTFSSLDLGFDHWE